MKTIDELTFFSDVIFSVVMRQEKYCKPLLEFIFGVKIKKINYINDQETISSDVITARSIRLDVYVEDGAGTVYDIEVQTTDKHINHNLRAELSFLIIFKFLKVGLCQSVT